MPSLETGTTSNGPFGSSDGPSGSSNQGLDRALEVIGNFEQGITSIFDAIRFGQVGRNNAQLLRNQATIEIFNSNQRIRDITRLANRIRGRQAATAVARGVALSGSVTQAIIDTSGEEAIAKARERFSTTNTVNLLNFRAKVAKFEAKRQQFQAISGGLKSFGKAFASLG